MQVAHRWRRLRTVWKEWTPPPHSHDAVTLCISQRDVRTSLEYGKVDAGVFFRTCLELFLFLLGLTEVSVPGVFQTEAQPVVFTPNPQCLLSLRPAGQ